MRMKQCHIPLLILFHNKMSILKFLDSPSPFHVVLKCTERLQQNGYERLLESKEWNLKLGGKYFVTRNDSSIVAFQIGELNCFNIVAAHTDSPCLKLKPKFEKEKLGYKQLGVQLYGGGLWHTWFDRDLGVAGRVWSEGKSMLLCLKEPICRIPTLAIHLDREAKDQFKFNLETHLQPVLGSVGLTNRILRELNLSSIDDVELCLFDLQEPCFGGLEKEYIFSARLDNLVMSYCALESLIQTKVTDTVAVMALFDNEEVGSVSAYGAQSNMLPVILERISNSFNLNFHTIMAKSFLCSADMAHAIHPNYPEKHESDIFMNKGVVIKYNANQRYATTSETASKIKQLAKKLEIPYQSFVVRNDSLCGSTIGPLLSSLGVKTVDVGNPQLSMHSIREQAGVKDVEYAISLFKEVYLMK